MRREWEMSEDDLEKLLDASKPVMCIKVGSYSPRSPQENANSAWEALGRKMGFDAVTVRPVQGKGDRVFTAVETCTTEQAGENLD